MKRSLQTLQRLIIYSSIACATLLSPPSSPLHAQDLNSQDSNSQDSNRQPRDSAKPKSQTTAAFQSHFPDLAQAMAARDPNAIRKAYSNLPPEVQQQVLSTLHSDRISPSYLQNDSLNRTGTDNDNPSPMLTSPKGGASLANFSELMQLIETTVSPDVWLNAGGTATMSPFRQGVRIDPDGIIERLEPTKIILGKTNHKKTSTPKLQFPNQTPNEDAQPTILLSNLGQWQSHTELRWVSLRQLDRDLANRIDEGKSASIAAELLGGLCRIDYVLVDPQNNDCWIAGPAGNIAATKRGDLIHRELLLPPVLLEDLLCVAAHVLQGRREFGCSIDPDPTRLVGAYQMANEKASLRLLSRDPETWVERWKEKLGPQQANIIGIPQDSPTGFALIIADAHMKRLAFGLEPSTGNVGNYWLESDRRGDAREQSMVRWWFALSNHPISHDPDNHLYHFAKPNVQVLSETQWISSQGQRLVAAAPDAAADAFAKNFTTHFEELQKTHPIYGRLRHVFDLAVALEIARTEFLAIDAPEFDVIGDPKYSPRLPVAPKSIESIVATRKRNDDSISAIVSGGVSINPQLLAGKLRRNTALADRLLLPNTPDSAHLREEENSSKTTNSDKPVFESSFWK